MNILVTGSNGYIGSSIKRSFINCSLLSNSYNITYINRELLDLCDTAATNNFFINTSFDVVIHTAASGGNRLEAESGSILDNNLLMYYNLLNNRQHFNKFIYFGSGAEFFNPPTMYSLSKQVIYNSILDKNNFYNIRIYGVFNEDELDRRFIKKAIINKKNNRSIVINKDTLMDFIYMEDLLKLLDYYITNNDMPKSIDCTYKETYKLTEIADFINSLGSKVDVTVKQTGLDTYCGKYNTFLEKINYIGLKAGIVDTYNTVAI